MIVGITQSFATADDKEVSSHIYFDKNTYGFGQKAIVTLIDKNLNKHYDAIDAYRPQNGFVFLRIDGKTMSDVFTQKNLSIILYRNRSS